MSIKNRKKYFAAWCAVLALTTTMIITSSLLTELRFDLQVGVQHAQMIDRGRI